MTTSDPADLEFLRGRTLPAPLRQDRIVSIVDGAPGLVRTTALAAALGTSEVTVRGDLAALDHAGRVRRAHGGAVRVGSVVREERPFEETAVEGADAKAAIGRVTAALVRSGECVVLDVGTTTAAVAEALVLRDDLTDVTVVTNSLTNALILERAVPRFTVIVTGGTLRPLQHSLVAPFVGTVLPMIAADVAVIGCSGVSVEHGVTNVNLPEAEVKRLLAGIARRTVVVADGAKLGRSHIGVVGALDTVDVLVTAAADPTDLVPLRDAGLRIVVADDTTRTEHHP